MPRKLVVRFVFLCGLMCATPAGAGQPGLLGHWKFDEGQGDVAVDSSDQANDGELADAQWVKGKFVEMIKSIHPHPTMSEAIMEAAAAAYGEVIHL